MWTFFLTDLGRHKENHRFLLKLHRLGQKLGASSALKLTQSPASSVFGFGALIGVTRTRIMHQWLLRKFKGRDDKQNRARSFTLAD